MPAIRTCHPLSCALAAAVAGHLCLLGWLMPQPTPQRVRVPAAQPAAVRAVVRDTTAAIPVAAAGNAVVPPREASPAAAMPIPVRGTATTARTAMRVRAAAVATTPVERMEPAPLSVAEAAQAGTAEVPASGASAAAAPPGALPLAFPPSQRLQFTARRGARAGRAELRWERTEAGGYELLLVLRYDGQEREALIQSSRGDVGEAGLQPRRYADRRGDAGLRSVEFAPGEAAGAQDRLSWLVQLSAISAAWAEAPAVGAHIALPVAGARGERDDWIFEVVGLESMPGPQPLLHLSRAPLHRHDHRIDVWLDARQGGWPVRMSWSHPERETLVFERENALQQR